MKVYIELFRARRSWLELSDEERARYLQGAAGSIQELVAVPGVELVGAGSSDPGTSNHSGYDFFAVWRLPDGESVEILERGIDADRWYDYFEQVNTSGELAGLETAMAGVVAAR